MRKRRSPEEAKSAVLAAAQSRLTRFGLDGLNIAMVASDAGISHGTLLHHFGSAEGMRHSLIRRMTQDMLEEIVTALQDDLPPGQLLQRLFHSLSGDNRSKLIAWRYLDPGTPQTLASDHAELFSELIRIYAEGLPGGEAQARKVVMLVTSAAVGAAVAGDMLPRYIGMQESDLDAFPVWLCELIERNAVTPDP